MQKGKTELRFIEPMECLEVDAARVPDSKAWAFEIKHDGYRAIAIKQDNTITIYSRNGKMLTQVPNLYTELNAVKVKQFVLDGECVVLDEQGRSSFELMQKIRSNKRLATFFAFDVLHLDGDDLLNLTLRERRKILETHFAKLPAHVRLSPILKGSSRIVLDKLREFEFEGVIAKRWDSKYEPGKRSGAWVKHKTQRSDDFVIGGYIGDRSVEQLLVGEIRDGKLYFVESVKNGFVPATRLQSFKAIERLRTDAIPFVNLPEKGGAHAMDKEKMREVHWLKPKVIAEIAFNERTTRGHLRHSRFVRLRPDKVH